MARRRRNHEEGGSLDSLLDTMTNVVGILVIVLVVTQLGVKDAVNRIAQTESVKPEAIAEVQQQLGNRFIERAGLEQELDALKSADPEQIRRTLAGQIVDRKNQVDHLRRQRDDQLAAINRRVAQAEQKLTQQQKELADLARRRNELQDEIARLKARLADTPQLPKLPPKVVHLPNPRPAPKGVKPVTFLCRDGRIMLVNLEGAQTRAEKWTAVYVKQKRLDRDPQKGIDCAVLFRAFRRASFDDDNFVLLLEDRGGLPYIVFQRKKNAGETAEKIEQPRSAYQRMIKSLNPEQYYLRFLVFTDSFELYLKARRIATQQRLLAGWQPMGGDAEYSVRLRGPLRCGPPPPPPPKPKKPAPPRPPQPPREPPSDTID